MARKPTLPRNAPRPTGAGVSSTGVRNLSALDRQMQALDLRKSGASFAQIAQALGYATPSGAHKAVMSAIKKTLREPAEEVRTLELERLDRLQMAAWTKAIKGDLRAIDAVLRIMKRRAELLGLDAPARINVEMAVVEEVDRMIEAGVLSEADRAAAVAEAEAILRRQA